MTKKVKTKVQQLRLFSCCNLDEIMHFLLVKNANKYLFVDIFKVDSGTDFQMEKLTWCRQQKLNSPHFHSGDPGWFNNPKFGSNLKKSSPPFNIKLEMWVVTSCKMEEQTKHVLNSTNEKHERTCKGIFTVRSLFWAYQGIPGCFWVIEYENYGWNPVSPIFIHSINEE